MPRKSSFSRSNNSSRNTTSTTAPRQAPPQAPPQPQQRTGFMSGLMGTVFQGMAFGAGSEIAHQAVRGVMGGNGHSQEVTHQAQAQAQAQAPEQQMQQNQCQMQNHNFVECLKFNSNNIQSCQDYLNELKKCESSFR